MRRIVSPAAVVLLLLALGPASSQATEPPAVRALDGKGNNLFHDDWGQAGTQYLRVAPRNYADGIASMVGGPDPRYISNRVFNDTSQNLFSENGVTQWGFVWGQFMDHVFGLRQEAGGEQAPMAFDKDDPLEQFENDLGAIDFARTPAAPGTGAGLVPREQINTVSSYIDAWNVYGGTNARLEWLRRGTVDGSLANNRAALLLPNNYLPRADARGDATTAPEMALMGRLMGNPAGARVAGDVRANENIALTATHTLFAREHNRIVAALPTTLSEEERFQIARRVVGAEELYITYTEFLPALGIELAPYTGYRPWVNASLSNEFAVVGYRAHSMIHGELEPVARATRYTAEELQAFEEQGVEIEYEDGNVILVTPLNVAFGNPDLLQQIGLGPVLKGIGLEPQYKNDEQIDNQLRSVLFQIPVPGNEGCLDGPTLPDCFDVVLDLGAVDVMRGRDHGLPFYNELRKAYGLSAKTSFTAITGEASESFPSDPELTAGGEIDDPDSIDFAELRDADGNEIEVGSDEAGEGAVFGRRRTPLAARLKAIYGDVDKVDAFVGMISERHVPGTEFGSLQRAIWKKQFEALRDGDRFFYVNDPQLEVIRTLYGIDYRHTLGEIIELNTAADVADDVFKVPEEEAPAPTGLVAAYGFDEGLGLTVGDASGNGNLGTIRNATWSTSGKFGGALWFDGDGDWVTVADAPTLDLTTGMTLEAWVKPFGLSEWRTIVLKEQPGNLIYALYANSTGDVPAANVFVGGVDVYVTGASMIGLSIWTHLAATDDGTTLRLYKNGVPIASRAVSGPIATSAGPLRIGGNAVWPEFYAGLIDEVRVYDHARSQTEIVTDMATPIRPA